MAGTRCDNNDCEKAVDHILRITRPDWMVEQVPSVDSKESEVYLCDRHAGAFGDGVSAEVEKIA